MLLSLPRLGRAWILPPEGLRFFPVWLLAAAAEAPAEGRRCCPGEALVRGLLVSSAELLGLEAISCSKDKHELDNELSRELTMTSNKAQKWTEE